jgi:type I restriction enzyme, S subunit
MFEAESVGIAASGEPIKNNDLHECISDYQLFNAQQNVVHNHSKVINFKEIYRWDVKSYRHSIESRYEFKKLKHFIYEHSEKVKLFQYPDDEFNILGVTNRGGVYLNITDKGSEFNQAYKKVRAQELTYNPYRVNVGSIGIVPEEYDGYFISPAYVVFGVKEGLLHEYLYLVLASDWFNPLLRAATTGSVRQNLTYQLLEDLEIPFPDMKTQENIVKRYQLLQQKKADIDRQLYNFKEEIKKDIVQS